MATVFPSAVLLRNPRILSLLNNPTLNPSNEVCQRDDLADPHSIRELSRSAVESCVSLAPNMVRGDRKLADLAGRLASRPATDQAQGFYPG